MVKHIAIIMDGNRRWAKEKGLSTSLGHLNGAKNLRKLAKHIFKRGVKVLSVFAFSTENFKRDKKEVDYLMDLFLKEIKKLQKEVKDENLKIVFSGRKKGLSENLIKEMEKLEDISKINEKAVLNVCLNYGGVSEILDATKKIAKLYKEEKLDLENLNEEDFYKYLYQDLPPIDLMIRTSGEYRISNFMLYQLAYSEMIFTDTYFPAFNDQKFDQVYDEFLKRNRRFGK